MTTRSRLAVAVLAAVTALGALAAPALADHPVEGFAPLSPPLGTGFNSGGEGAEWELLATIPTGNPHTDLDFFTQGGETFVSSGTLAAGANGGGQTIVQLTEAGEVSPSFVSAHPSASCFAGSGVTGLQHDVEASPKGDVIFNTTNPSAVRTDAQILIDTTDQRGRCHDQGSFFGASGAPRGGLEIIDITDVANPVEIGLTSHIAEAHTVNVDPKRPHIAYAVSSSQVNFNNEGVRANEPKTTSAGDPNPTRFELDGWEMVDLSSCMNFPEGTTVDEKRESCRPEVFRFRYPDINQVRSHTLNNTFGCHELELYPDDRLSCAGGSAATLWDVSGAFDDNGTPDDFSDDTLRGTPLACTVRGSTSSPVFRTDAMITDCVDGEGDGTDDLSIPFWLESGAPSVEGIRHLGSAHHLGGLSNNLPATEDISFNHESELTQSRRFVIATDERGGGVLPPGATCSPGIDNTTGNGGLHAYAVDRLDTSFPASVEEAQETYARTPDGEKAIFRAPIETTPEASFCTAHVFQQVPGQNRIFMAWYTQGTRVVDFIEHPDGTFEFKEAGFFVPENANQWVSHVFRSEINPDGTYTYFGVANDFSLGAAGRNAIDVYQVTLPAPPLPAPPLEEPGTPPPGTPSPGVTPSATQDEVRRVEGEDRIETAVNVSEAAFDRADGAVLARVDDYPDALAASGLAAELDAPVLLTDTDGLDQRVGVELQRLGVERAYLAGGTAALSADVEADLDELEIAHTRVGGEERYQTAALIAEEVVALGGPVDEAIVALGGGRTEGGDFPDALAAGNLAAAARAPVVLVQPDTVPDVTRATLGRLLDDGATVYISGGPDAVGAGAEQELTDEGYAPQRLAGGDRYATAVAVTNEAVRQGAGVNPTLLASGEIFQDALVAAPAARRLGGVMVLVHPEDINSSTATRDFLAENAEAIDTVLITGDSDTVSDDVFGQVQSLIADRESSQRASSGAPMSANAGLLILGLTALPAAGLWGRRRRQSTHPLHSSQQRGAK